MTWTPNEERFIRDYWESVPVSNLAYALDKSVEEVHRHADKLRLPSRRNVKPTRRAKPASEGGQVELG